MPENQCVCVSVWCTCVHVLACICLNPKRKFNIWDTGARTTGRFFHQYGNILALLGCGIMGEYLGDKEKSIYNVCSNRLNSWT